MANSGNLPEGQFAHEKKLFLTPRQRQLAEEVRSEASSINTTFMCETAKAAGQVLRPDQELAFWQTQR